MKIMDYATHHVVTVVPSDSIDHAIDLMEVRRIHHLVVAAENRVLGMLSDRDVLVSTGWMLSVERQARERGGGQARVVGPTRVDQIMSHPAFCLTDRHTSRDAGLLMLERKIGALPVLSQDRLVGLVSETDLVKWAPLSEVRVDRLLNRDVRSLMTAPVLSVTPEASIAEVIHLLRSRRIRHVPVVRRDRLVGIISDRDVRRVLGWGSVRDSQAEEEGHLMEAPLPQTAGEIMHESVRTAGPSTPLRDALRLMLDERIHSLPVVEAHGLTGIITQTDFLREFTREPLL